MCMSESPQFFFFYFSNKNANWYAKKEEQSRCILSIAKLLFISFVVSCFYGRYYNTAVSRCDKCEIGLYSNTTGASYCTPCDIDSTTTTTGTVYDTDCICKTVYTNLFETFTRHSRTLNIGKMNDSCPEYSLVYISIISSSPGT